MQKFYPVQNSISRDTIETSNRFNEVVSEVDETRETQRTFSLM